MVKMMSAEIESIEHELEQAIIALRKSGVRITPQRQAIVRFLISSHTHPCLLYTSPSPRDLSTSRMPSSA